VLFHPKKLSGLDFDTLSGEQALLNADIERQERPGTALRLADTNAVVGVRHSANQRASEAAKSADRHACEAIKCQVLCDESRSRGHRGNQIPG